jgi:uncharacterized membrane protein (DUF485 family)
MNAQEFVNSDRFKKLVSKRWSFSFIMLILLFIIYFGFVFLVALDKDFMVKLVAPNLTMGIVLVFGVIVGAWLLTIIYVIWANTVYDKEVEELKKILDN